MGNLIYKNYYGSVEYSEKDQCLFGKVLGLKNSLILYEGNSLNELKEDFESSVESYLERCKRKSIDPEQPYDGVLNIHVSTDIHVKMAEYTERRGTSIDSFVSDLIEKRLEAVT